MGVLKNGYFSDACRTYYNGSDKKIATLVKIGQEALEVGIQNAFSGNRLGTLGWAIDNYVKKNNCQTFSQFTGHGVGFAVHESPVVLHYGEKRTGEKINNGLVIAIEPIITMGSHSTYLADDGWTICSSDGSVAVQVEDTIAVTEKGPIVLTR